MGLFGSEGSLNPANIVSNVVRAFSGNMESAQEERKRREAERRRRLQEQQEEEERQRAALVQQQQQKQSRKQTSVDTVRDTLQSLTIPGRGGTPAQRVQNLGLQGLPDPNVIAEMAGEVGDARIAAEAAAKAQEGRQQTPIVIGPSGGGASQVPTSTFVSPVASIPISSPSQELSNLIRFATQARAGLDALRTSGIAGRSRVSPLIELLNANRRRGF